MRYRATCWANEMTADDEAWNAVAYASASYRREQAFLARALREAELQGMTVDEMAEASGLDETTVCRLLDGDWV